MPVLDLVAAFRVGQPPRSCQPDREEPGNPPDPPRHRPDVMLWQPGNERAMGRLRRLARERGAKVQ
jgi:hypothetical protein